MENMKYKKYQKILSKKDILCQRENGKQEKLELI